MAILIDLGVLLALLTGLIIAIIYVRPRIFPPAGSRPVAGRRGAAVRWAWALGLALAVLLGLNIAMLGYAKPPGLTTTVLIAGTWKAGGTGPAAAIQFSSNGTFTATSLPDPRSGIQQPLPGDQRGTWTIDREGGTKWFVSGILAANTQMRFTMVLRPTMDLPIPVTGKFLIYDIADGLSNTDAFSKQP